MTKNILKTLKRFLSSSSCGCKTMKRSRKNRSNKKKKNGIGKKYRGGFTYSPPVKKANRSRKKKSPKNKPVDTL